MIEVLNLLEYILNKYDACDERLLRFMDIWTFEILENNYYLRIVFFCVHFKKKNKTHILA